MRRTWVAGFILMGLLIVALWSSSLIVGEPALQGNATEQQQTIDALVQQRFEQTTTSQAALAATQTIDAAFSQALTATAGFNATLDAAFSQAATATRQAEVTARGLAIISPDNTTRIIELAALEGQQRILSVAFSPDSTTLASGGWARQSGDTIRLWDMATNTVRAALEAFPPPGSLSFSPDGTILASGSFHDSTVQLWDTVNNTLYATFEAQQYSVIYSVAFSPDSTTLAIGTGHIVQVWDITNGTLRATLSGHTGGVYSVAFSPDGRILASGSEDGTVRLWDIASGILRTVINHTGQVNSVAFSPDGATLASGGSNNNGGTVQLQDSTTGMLRATLEGNIRAVYGVAFNPSGTVLATGGSGEVLLWGLAGSVPLSTLPMQTLTRITCLMFSPDGMVLAGGGDDGTARLWGIPLNS